MTFPGSLWSNTNLDKVGGAGSLRDILQRFFLPELQYQAGGRGPIDAAFMSQVSTPGALYGAASEAAKGTASQLFAPGGDVAAAIAKARGATIGQGWSPSSAAGSERGILDAATKRVADTFATNAGQLESQRFGALTQTWGQQGLNIQSLLESLFTGAASADQLKLARNPPRQKILGLF